MVIARPAMERGSGRCRPVKWGAVIGVELDMLEVPGLAGPLSLRVPIGRVRAVVSPVRRVARALADAITGITPAPDRVRITGPANGKVRLVPSDGALLPHLTVLQNIIAARRYPPELAQEVRTRAVHFGLDALLDRYPSEIQVGQRRMAGLARALRARPDAIVLEDDSRVPSWGALLVQTWRGYQVRLGGTGPDEPRTPELLMGVATVLIVPTREHARLFDQHPVVLDAAARGRESRAH